MNNNGTKELETDRLILRKFVMDDAKQMYYNWASDNNVAMYFAYDPHKNIEETKRTIEQWIEEYKKDYTYIWAIQERTSNEIIGTINAWSVSTILETCEIAYSIGSKWWNKGYATEALKAVITYLLKEEEFYLIEAKHNSVNIASGRVLGKAGMTREAVLRDRRIDKVSGERKDLVIYSIIRPELNHIR